jgi:uncharacterized pyridoxal phosphate-containing UPF0001 family protein
MTADPPDRGGPALSTVATRLAAVRGRIAAAARSVGRDASDVRLVAVSKLHALERVLEANAAGQDEFGESRAQELDAKLADVRSAPLRWHFVGQLQRNKVPLVVGRVELIHSVDRERLVRAIGDHLRRVGSRTSCCRSTSRANSARAAARRRRSRRSRRRSRRPLASPPSG